MLVYSRTNATLDRWGSILAQKLKEFLRGADLDASGQTIRSIDHDVVTEGDIIALEISGKSNKGESILDLLDTGQRPSAAQWPAAAIEQWIRDRGFTPKRNTRFVRKSDTNIKRAAYAIARAIRERGTIRRYGWQGANLYKQVFDPQADLMGNDIAAAYAMDVEDYLDGLTGAK